MSVLLRTDTVTGVLLVFEVKVAAHDSKFWKLFSAFELFN